MLAKRSLVVLRRYAVDAQAPARKAWKISHSSPLKVERLPNNLTVAIKSPQEEISGVTISIPAGSRYEEESPPGTAHFLKNALFMVHAHSSCRFNAWAVKQKRVSLGHRPQAGTPSSTDARGAHPGDHRYFL